MLKTDFDYTALLTAIANKEYSKQEIHHIYRKLSLTDLYFLLRYVLNRDDMENQWCYDRCKEISADPDFYIDLWFRGGYKSTIITYAKTIQDILNNPLLTFNIFGYKAPFANSLVNQISSTLKMSAPLQSLFPEHIPQGSRQDAYLQTSTVQLLTANHARKERNVQGSGLVEGMPTGIHCTHLVYDDIVTPDTVTSKESIRKLVDAYKLSLNLGTAEPTKRIVGTIYGYDDPFCTHFKDDPSMRIRKYPVIDSQGQYYLMTQEQVMKKRVEMGAYIFSCQMMLDPISPEDRLFNTNDLIYFDTAPSDIEWYILCDPALSEKKNSDNCVIARVGITPSKHIFVDHLRSIKTKSPSVIIDNILTIARLGARRIGVENVAFQEALQEPLKAALLKNNIFIPVEPLSPHGRSKRERISGLEPFTKLNMIHLRHSHTLLIDQFMKYPGIAHDDEIDCLAYILDYTGQITTQWDTIYKDKLFNSFVRKNNQQQVRKVSNKRREMPCTTKEQTQYQTLTSRERYEMLVKLLKKH